MVSPRHYQELKASCIDDKLIKLNFFSIDGSMGEQSPRYLILQNKPDAFCKNGTPRAWAMKYNPLDDGGWICYANDGSDYFQFKADTPIINKDGDPVKYISPLNTPTGIFLLRVTENIWKAIATRYQVPMPEGEDISFWHWVKANPTIPIMITEGAKKAGALLTAGYVAIALPGHNMGMRSVKNDGKVIRRYLHPVIQDFAIGGREFVICLDNDEKPSTKEAVGHSIRNIGSALLDLGCHSSVTTWEQSLGKGIDDVIANYQGESEELFSKKIKYVAIEDFIENSKKEWKRKKDWERWVKNKTFTPDVTIDVPFLSLEAIGVPLPNTITAIRAGLGGNKTGWAALIVSLLWKEGWLIPGYRNTLLLNICDRINRVLEANGHPPLFKHIHDGLHASFIKDNLSMITLCLDSMFRFSPEDFNGKNIIIDEVVSVVRHALDGGTLGSKQRHCLELLKEALVRANRIILLDGNLSDKEVDYIASLAQNKTVTKILNKHQNNRTKFYFHQAINLEGEIKKRDRSPILQRILKATRPIICTDSQIEGEAIEQILIKNRGKGIRVDSETVTTDEVKEFLKNPDKWIKENKPDYLVYTPSAESGLDVSIKGYFDAEFCLFFGVLLTDAQMQMIFRPRDISIERHVWCNSIGLAAPSNKPKAYTPKMVESLLEKFVIQSGNLAIDGLDQQEAIRELMDNVTSLSKDEHYQHSCILQASDNFERNNLRDCLIHRLKSLGHEVIEVLSASSEVEKELEKETKEAIFDKKSKEIFNADDIPVQYVDEFITAFGANAEDQRKIDKAIIKKKLPEIQESILWSWEFIKEVKFKNKRLISQLELLWLFHHPEVSKRMLQEEWHYLTRKEKMFIGNLRSRHSRVWALHELKLGQFIDNPTRVWDKDSLEVIELVDRARDPEIQLALGIAPGKPTKDGKERIAFLRKLLGIVGLSLSKGKGNTKRVYQLGAPHLFQNTILACLDRRWEAYTKGEREIPDFFAVEEGEEAIATNPPQSYEEDSREAIDLSRYDLVNGKVIEIEQPPLVEESPTAVEEAIATDPPPQFIYPALSSYQIGDRVWAIVPWTKTRTADEYLFFKGKVISNDGNLRVRGIEEWEEYQGNIFTYEWEIFPCVMNGLEYSPPTQNIAPIKEFIDVF